MPNWCANRLRVTGLAGDIEKVRALMAGEGVPAYVRAESEGIQLFLAGCAGLLQPATDDVYAPFCEEYKPDEEEIQHVLRTIGSTDMAEYQAVGVTMGRVQEILLQHREARNRKVSVPAMVLERILERSEREFRKQDQAAANAGYDTPVSVTRSLEDIYAMKLLLLAA